MNGARAHNESVYANLEREAEAVGVKVQCVKMDLVHVFYIVKAFIHCRLMHSEICVLAVQYK